MNALLQLPKELLRNGRRRPRPRKRYGLMARVQEALGQKELPKRDREFLKWIRRQDCILCVQYGLIQQTPTEAAHLGPNGLEQKACDTKTRPLCREHHLTAPDSAHVLGRNFLRFHGLEN